MLLTLTTDNKAILRFLPINKRILLVKKPIHNTEFEDWVRLKPDYEITYISNIIQKD